MMEQSFGEKIPYTLPRKRNIDSLDLMSQWWVWRECIPEPVFFFLNLLFSCTFGKIVQIIGWLPHLEPPPSHSWEILDPSPLRNLLENSACGYFIKHGPRTKLIKKFEFFYFYRPRKKYEGRYCFHRCLSVHISGGGYPHPADGGGYPHLAEGVPHLADGGKGTPIQLTKRVPPSAP